MGATLSKNHHFVPKAILRQFCFSGETLYYISKDKRNLEPRNINSVFRKRHFNTFEHEDGTRDDTIERFFAEKLDNHIPEWIGYFERKVKTGEELFPDTNSRKRFIQFFYNHMKRTPDFIEPIVRRVASDVFQQETIDRFERDHRTLTDEEKKLFYDRKFQEKSEANSRVWNFSRQSEKVMNRLLKMQIVIASPQRESNSFIVGSNPVVRFEEHPKQELGEAGVELWTTVTPKIAVGFVAGNAASPLLYFSSDAVRKLNGQLTRKSKAIGGHSKRLIESLSSAFWPNN